MEFHEFGDENDPNLVFVLGWGNRVDEPDVEWFVDRLVDAGYHVHAAELPDECENFERDYLDPLVDLLAGLDSCLLLSHSTGGLVTAHLPVATPQVYLSPFWGWDDEWTDGWLTTMREAQAALPEFREGSVVFCSLRDEVVSVRAIGERAPASAVQLYDGGHELFASASRDEATERVLAALESTPRLSLGGE